MSERLQYPLAENLPHPMQPIGWDGRGVIRFKSNAIIEWLFETERIDLNDIAIRAARGQFGEADQMQLAQLLGYSVSGYGDLSYASAESVDAADAEADRIAGRPAPSRPGAADGREG